VTLWINQHQGLNMQLVETLHFAILLSVLLA